MVFAGPMVSAADSQTGYRTRLRVTPRTRPEEQLLRKVDALRASCWRLSNLHVPAAANTCSAAATGRFADRRVDETDGNQMGKSAMER